MSQYKKDMIASFFFLILGALVLISVPLTIQDPGVSVMGPRVFPYFIGACMVILSLALMLTTIVKHRKAGGADSTGTFASEEERKRALRDELRALLLAAEMCIRDSHEHHTDVVCIAAPVFDVDNQVLAAIGIAAPDYRFSLEKALSYSGEILRCAARITEKLGWHYPIRVSKKRDEGGRFA